jgi:hypothetical protein
VLIPDGGLVDGEGVLVGAGRGLSRQVGVHCWNDTVRFARSSMLSPCPCS